MAADWIAFTQLATPVQLRSPLAPEDCARLIAELDKPKANFALNACCAASVQTGLDEPHQFSVERKRLNRRYWYTPVRVDGILQKDGDDTLIDAAMKIGWHDLMTLTSVLVFFGVMLFVLVANVMPGEGIFPSQGLALIGVLLVLLMLYLGYRLSRLQADRRELLTLLENVLHAKVS